MNPSLSHLPVALAVAIASAPLVALVPGDAGRPGTACAAHAWRTIPVLAAARGAMRTHIAAGATEHWQTIELPGPSRLGPTAALARHARVRT